MQKLYDWSILIITILALLPASLYAQERNASNSSTNDHSQIGRETHVTPTQALNVGYTFMRTGNNTRGNSVSKQTMQLVYTGRAVDSLTLATTDCYYVFSLQPKGFVIVAADDRVEPILGYSYDNNFVVENMPDHVRGWLGNYEKQIEAVVKQDIAPEAETTTKWSRLKAGQSMSTRSGESVGPLLTTQWDQWYPYNAQCPNGCPTGCTATATAQIMNYWQWPAKGVGYHSYRRNNFGTLSVFFNENDYVWDSMTVNHPNHISKLMYHVGVAMDMDYDYGASSAYLNSAQGGLQRYFDYSDSSVYVHREDYSDGEWNDMLTNCLNTNMPILYEGYGSGGHAWVVDGYDMNGFFHMNYGWSGSYDGYYSLNSLNIFNDNQGAVLGIHPNYSPLTADFEFAQGDSVLMFNFYDFSKGASIQYLWQFGDGGIDTSANPIHSFDSGGTYLITLIVGDGIFYDTLIRSIEISIPSFIPSMIELANLHPYCPPVILDYDRDGLLDFFATGCYWQYLYHNEDSTFSCFVLDNPNQTINTLPIPAIVDFLHENKPSILSSEREGFYFYNSDGTLVKRLLPLSIINNEAYLIVGDYNGDGEDDILLDGLLYKNIGNMNFIKVSDEFYDAQLMSDYDGDGDLDFIGYWIYRNDGNDEFACIPSFSSFPPSFRPFAINPWTSAFSQGDMADINVDGKPDFVSGNHIYINEGEDLFTEHEYYEDELTMCSSSSSIIDFNCNGKPETIKNTQINSKVFELGHNNYTDSLSALIILDSQGGAPIDYDNNNIPDVVKLNFYGLSQIYYNTCPIVNNSPSIPQNLWVDTIGNSVVLHWDTVSDDHSRYGSITYNIMVGTALDSFDIKSPLSNIATGKRYAYNRGNAGHAPLWKLNNLPNGTYYWRVQAIDNSLAASPFSESGTFVINGNNLPPLMSNLTITSYCNRRNYLSGEALKERFTDRENDTLQGFQIIKAPTNGVLHMGDSVVQINQYVSYSDIDSIWFITNMFEDDSLWVKVFDGHGYSKDSSLIRFNVKLFEKTFEVTGVSGDVAWGDYDKDGKADFACTSGIYHNTGNGFEKLADSIPPAERVLWADINNDGWLDCLFDGYVLTNTGTGHFTFDSTLVDWSETGVAVGDVNNDNKVDYVLSGSPDHFAEMASRLFYNIGGSLSNDSVNSNLQGYRGGDIAVVDFDNDGRQDVLMNGIDDYGNHRSTTLFRNILIGSLSSTSDSLYGVNKGSLCYGDYDHDGDIDLLMCGTQGTWDNFITIIYDNNGAGMLDEHVFPRGENPFQPVALGQAKWYDFDNDGYLDVILSGISSGTRLYKNNGGICFEEMHNTNLPDLSYTSIDIIDYDGDGYSDLLLSGNDDDGNPMIVVYNNCNGTENSSGNNQIAVPSDLSAEIRAYDATLSWNGENDGNCSYNVYVRNNDGYIVSPMADVTSGFRKVVSSGNAGTSNHYTIKNLPCGTYYWSVQSVNKSQCGGMFAPEQLFVISPTDADTVVVFDTACVYYGTGLHTYRRSGIFYERYEREGMNDSVVELHLTIHHDCTPIIYVALHSVAYEDGCSWKSAYHNLQRGIEMAMALNGDVWAAEGVYSGEDDLDFAFVLTDISLFGGFAGNESDDFNLALRDFQEHPTVLDGQNRQGTVSVYWWGNTLIDGCVIRNGKGYNINGSIKINNCRIQGSPSGSSLENVEITNSIIERGSSFSYGCNVKNSVIVGPSISISATWSSYSNCIFWNNENWLPNEVITYSAMQGMGVWGEGNISLANVNDGNDPDSNYVRFVDPNNGDFRLAYGSACINAGTPDISELGLPSVDLQGLPRVLGGRIDMGAYEYYPVPIVETYDTACEGNGFAFFDSICTATGNYVHHTNVVDVTLDTLYVLHLTVSQATFGDTTAVACESYTWNGTTYAQSGDYTQTFSAANGCDSVVTLHLTITNTDHTDFTDVACDSYTWNGETYTQSGTYSQTFTNSVGCDSVVTLHLTISNTDFTDFTDEACENYSWNGETYTESGDYTQTFTNSVGCDSVVTLHLTITNTDYTDFTDVACDSYTWNGETYTESGDYTQTFTNSVGCDSVVTLLLTITNTDHTDFTDVACDSYTWNGETYTESGTYSQTFTNSAGCDSVVTLHLTVNYSNTGDTTAVACESFTWYGTTYTESGDYTSSSSYWTNAAGCDSVVTLHLTIKQPVNSTVTETACESFSWNGNTYTQSGDYPLTLTAANGCDSIVTLHLTITNTDHTDFTDVACDSYTWNGETYTQSGDYTQSFTNSAGCDSVVTLHLTINYSNTGDTTAVACENFTWRGTTYTESGSYLSYQTTTAGCDSIVTLHLTINNPVHTAVTEVACESFTWNGTDYTVSGDYTYNHTDANGCTQVDTLHLTIYNPVHTAITETACESFTWNGTDYTVSGDYTYNHADENGCTQVDTLHLTIHFAQSAEFAVATADSCYTWNAQTYCTSGDYTQTFQTIHGCDSVVTLHLTITVGVDNYDSFDFKVYPNPTSNIVNVECIMHNEEWGEVELHLCDAYGRLLDVVETGRAPSLQTVQIDLSRYASGIYFVKAVADGETVAVRKVVKQ